jgi:hypothetical protein
MKNVLRAICAAALATFLVTSACVPSDAVAAQVARPSAFDGQWSVVIYTLQGDCSRSLRYAVRIVDGRVQAADQNYQAAGTVAASGAIRVVVAEGGRSASGSGRLVGNNGRGVWRTSTGECAGQWTAMRRAAEY